MSRRIGFSSEPPQEFKYSRDPSGPAPKPQGDVEIIYAVFKDKQDNVIKGSGPVEKGKGLESVQDGFKLIQPPRYTVLRTGNANSQSPSTGSIVVTSVDLFFQGDTRFVNIRRARETESFLDFSFKSIDVFSFVYDGKAEKYETICTQTLTDVTMLYYGESLDLKCARMAVKALGNTLTIKLDSGNVMSDWHAPEHIKNSPNTQLTIEENSIIKKMARDPNEGEKELIAHLTDDPGLYLTDYCYTLWEIPDDWKNDLRFLLNKPEKIQDIDGDFIRLRRIIKEPRMHRANPQTSYIFGTRKLKTQHREHFLCFIFEPTPSTSPIFPVLMNKMNPKTKYGKERSDIDMLIYILESQDKQTGKYKKPLKKLKLFNSYIFECSPNWFGFQTVVVGADGIHEETFEYEEGLKKGFFDMKDLNFSYLEE